VFDFLRCLQSSERLRHARIGTCCLVGLHQLCHDLDELLLIPPRILDTVHLIVVCQSVYHYLVTDWGFLPALNVATWELVIHIFLIGLSSIVCQVFFLHRQVAYIIPCLGLQHGQANDIAAD
jgi:hypothetical protein